MSWLSGIPIIGDLIELGSVYIKGKQKIKLASDSNTARLISDTNSNNSAWELSSLSDKDKWLRRGSFAMFALPFIWAVFDPNAVKDYFDVALDSMPEWYIKMFGVMIGGIWGVATLKNIFSGIKK